MRAAARPEAAVLLSRVVEGQPEAEARLVRLSEEKRRVLQRCAVSKARRRRCSSAALPLYCSAAVS